MESSLSELDWKSFKSVCANLSTYGLVKFVTSMIMAGFMNGWDWLFGHKIEMVSAVLCLIMLDTITGVWKASKAGQLSSRGFFRFAAKLLVYMLLLTTASLVDKNIPIAFALSMMATFLALTEAISILENVAKLGFPVPHRMISILKQFSEEKQANGSGQAQEKK